MNHNDTHNNDGHDVASLKDLNISDKKKISNVLHGRKASTYLRIFRDDDGLADDKDKDKSKDNEIDKDPGLSRAPVHPQQMPHLKPALSIPSAPKRKTSSSLYDTHYKSSTLPRRKFSRSRDSSSGEQLKPVSSATYYPHKSDGQTSPVEDHLPVPKLALEQQEISLNGDNEMEKTTSDAIETDDDYYDDDEEQDHQSYPLAVELQPFTNNVGGHTAIFRFSKRAVCKALVNRENKWYENIEMKHKELLQFMPRYIGVLNVRQHIYNKDDVLSEATTTTTAVNDNDRWKPGCPLTHIHSFPFDNISMHSSALPEVVLDDNRHMISDSLLGISNTNANPNSNLNSDSHSHSRSHSLSHPHSHSPSSLPTDACIYSNGHSSFNKDKLNHIFHNLGSTTVNTKLKALVLQEVFAPASHYTTTTTTNQLPNQRKLVRKSRASSHDNSRRNSNQSLKNMPTQPITSPLLKKSLKESISHALNSPNSLMDLRQFHQKEMAREFIEDEEQNETSDDKNHSSTKSSPVLDPRESVSPLTLPLDRRITNDSGIFDMDDDEVTTSRLPEPAHKSNNTNESVSFEEHSDTIVSKYILLEDLTRKLNRPCALDLKMGTRQYGVDAKRSKQLSQREKCLNTTSRKLGVRICGLKVWDNSYYIVRDKYFGRRVKIGWQFTRVLSRFIYDGKEISSIIKQIPRLIKQLDTLSAEISNLKGYRLYGSSLLLMYDGNNPGNKRCRVKVNLIDFARCVTKEAMDHGIGSFSIPPKNPQLEDRGFLRGIRSLKFYLMSIWNYLTGDHPLCTDEDELNQLLNENESKFSINWDWLDEFDNETEEQFNDPNSELRTKWRKFELIFDLEPRYNNDGDVSD